MDVVGIVGVCELLRGFVLDFRQDDGGEGRGLRGGGCGVLGQDCCLVRYTGAE